MYEGRSGVRKVISGGKDISSVRDSTAPSAMVPSWQLRHNADAPVGWPTVARMVLLS